MILENKLTLGLAKYFFFISMFALTSQVYAEATAIITTKLINPISKKVENNKIIIVEESKIVAIVDSIEDREITKTIDLTGKWVGPGLIDTHVHLSVNFDYRSNGWSAKSITDSDVYRSLIATKNAKLFLEGGFTTVKEIGNDGNYIGADLKRAIREGIIPGPRIVYAGKIIAPYGGQTHGYRVDKEDIILVEYFNADSKDEMRKAIRKNIYHGADTIKIVNGDQNYFYTEDDIAFMVSEAKRAGKTITAHALGEEPAKNAILGGVDAIEHGFELDEELLKLMIKHDVYLVGTDFSYENLYAYGWSEESTKQFHKMIVERLILAHKLGVKMAFGSDIVIDLPNKNRLETSLSVLDTWEAANIPAFDAYQAMTSNAAKLLKMNTEIGSVEAGKYADIVAFDDNPLDAITNVNSVSFVMKSGKVIKHLNK